MEPEPLGRLGLAAICVATLVGARWRHERQAALLQQPGWRVAGGGPDLDPSVPQRRRPWLVMSWSLLRRHRSPKRPLNLRLSLALYWLGLTTSAALAGQAIAALVRRGW
jgi:hypothetical protein